MIYKGNRQPWNAYWGGWWPPEPLFPYPSLCQFLLNSKRDTEIQRGDAWNELYLENSRQVHEIRQNRLRRVWWVVFIAGQRVAREFDALPTARIWQFWINQHNGGCIQVQIRNCGFKMYISLCTQVDQFCRFYFHEEQHSEVAQTSINFQRTHFWSERDSAIPTRLILDRNWFRWPQNLRSPNQPLENSLVRHRREGRRSEERERGGWLCVVLPDECCADCEAKPTTSSPLTPVDAGCLQKSFCERRLTRTANLIHFAKISSG